MDQDEEGRRAKERDEERIDGKMAVMIEEATRKEEGKEDVAVKEKEKQDQPKEDVDMVINAINYIEEMKEQEVRSVDVVELFSPPRVTKVAKELGLRAGLAMDLTNGWDFSIEKHKQAAEKYIKLVKPWIVIGSPECRMFSQMQNLAKKYWNEDKEKMMNEAKEHIRFVMRMYKLQWESGRYFLHEHPAEASSWYMKEVQDMMTLDGVQVTRADQCMYGLKTWSNIKGKLDTPARKTTRFMTNSDGVAKELQKRCDAKHEHQALVDGRAKGAAIYPRALCEAICKGIAKERIGLIHDVKSLVTVGPKDKIGRVEGGAKEERKIDARHEEEDCEGMMAWDDLSGEALDPKEVLKARLKELEYIRQKGVWRKISRREAKALGIKIFQTRWIDINKGDLQNMIHRSRLVGKEFNNGKDDSLFAATPPLEALRLLISAAATGSSRKKGGRKAIMINDVARAFFEAKATRDVCVELPDEDKDDQDVREDNVAVLLKSLYGTRDAALNFQKEVKAFMKTAGFESGRYNVSTYCNKERDMKNLVHGDDFVTEGDVEDLLWLKSKLEERFEIKTTIIGSGTDEAKEGRVLNRIIRCTNDGWEYEADQRHAEYIIKALNMQDAKPVVTPGEESKPWKEAEEEQELSAEQSAEYRSLAARTNYLAADRLDIQFAVKEICRAMSKPTLGDRRKLKRLARFLIGHPRVVSLFAW